MSAREDLVAGLMREHSAKLATYARHLGADDAFAKDAASEAFLRLCRQNEIRPDTAKAWLYKVCRNIVFNEFRRRRREQPCDTGGFQNLCDTSATAHAACIEKERAGMILDELQKLSEAKREVVFMRYYNGLEYSQIAYVLDMSVSNVGVTLTRAIAQMRKNLEGML